jgi:predicted Zn-dependent protease
MKNKKYLLLIAACILGAILFNHLFFPRNTTSVQTMINDVRQHAQPMLDSTMNAIKKENRFRDSLQYLISSGQLNNASDIIDQLLTKYPRDSYYNTLKGQIFDSRKMYDSALYYYNMAIALIPAPYQLLARAQTYIKMNKYQDAIDDSRDAYFINHYYSFKVAQAFELNKQKDSALKYYNIYLEQYPDSIYRELKNIYPPDSARQRIKKLSY